MADIGNQRTDIGAWESRPAPENDKKLSTTTTTTTTNTTNITRQTVNKERNVVSNNIFTMDELINETYFGLRDYLTVEKKISPQKLRECKGLLFVSLMKGGVGVGIMLAHDIVRNEWNGPCAISVSYISTGIEFNMERINYVILINNENMISLIAKGYLQIGSDIILTQDIESVNVHEQRKSSLFLLTREASNMNMSLDNAIITINKQCNEQYYQKQVEVFDMLSVSDSNFSELWQLLNNYAGESTSLATTIANKTATVTASAKAAANKINVMTATAATAVATAATTLTKNINKDHSQPSQPFNSDNNNEEKLKHEEIHRRKTEEKNKHIKWYLNEGIPLFQYYWYNKTENVTLQQLSSLPSFPFLSDVKNQKFKLTKYIPWQLSKKIYTQIKSYWPFKKK